MRRREFTPLLGGAVNPRSIRKSEFGCDGRCRGEKSGADCRRRAPAPDRGSAIPDPSCCLIRDLVTVAIPSCQEFVVMNLLVSAQKLGELILTALVLPVVHLPGNQQPSQVDAEEV